jgi:uncharacterized protein YndB with AHSA1/START domain
MAGRIDQVTSFTYTTYIQASPEQVWEGLTRPRIHQTLLAAPKGW